MYVRKIITWGILFILFCLPVGWAGGMAADGQVEEAVRDMVEREWAAYQEEQGFEEGGLFVYLLTPEDRVFATSGRDDADEQIHFRGASTTKTFTAASVMLMHQEGLLDIDDRITDLIPGSSTPYVPDRPHYALPYRDQITIRQLLGHRAGVFDVTNDSIPEDAAVPYAGGYYHDYVREVLGEEEHTYTFDELVGVAAENGLSYWPPDGGFHYSNTGYAILGKIIERVSGLSYGEYVAATFAEPLGLSRTSFPALGSETTLPSPYAPGYTYFDGQVYETTEDNMSMAVAEGNLITTPHDLALWLTLLLSGRAGLAPETTALMTDVSPTGEMHVWYGLGITYTEGLGYGHNGGHAGYLTVARYDPDHVVAVVVFASIINAGDIWGQGQFLVDVALQAKSMAGY